MQVEPSTLRVNRDKLFAALGPFGVAGGSQPNPDEPYKPGPWDPLIRIALKAIEHDRFGPFPEPWRSALSRTSLLELIARRFPQIWDVIGGTGLADAVALNPQPLPPRERLVVELGEALVARAELLGEVVRATDGGGADADDRGIIVVGGYIDRLVDEWCGTGFKPKWPFPGPRPRWFFPELTARDTLLLAATLHEGSRLSGDPAVAGALDRAAQKLAEAGVQ